MRLGCSTNYPNSTRRNWVASCLAIGATNALATQANDIAYVKSRFRDLFQLIVELSQGAQPPGAHAANGFFHDRLVTDPRIAAMGAKPKVRLGPGAQALFDVYIDWYNDMFYRVFRNADNVEANRTFDFIRSELGDIVQFGVDLFNAIFGSDQQKQQEAAARLKSDFDPLVQAMNANGNLPRSGRHMSGFIAKFSADTAYFNRFLLNHKVPAGTPGDVGKIADVIRGTMTQLNLLPTEGHDPWLKGYWQLQYQATLQAAITALDSI